MCLQTISIVTNMNTNETITDPAGQRMTKCLYHLQFYCIVWDSGRYVSMNSTYYSLPSPTELGTLTDFLAANVTLTWCYKPQDQDDLYHTSEHRYPGQSGLLETQIPNNKDLFKTFSRRSKETWLTLRGMFLR